MEPVGKENVSGIDAMHRTTNADATRKFGTPLRSNTHKFHQHSQSTQKKKVRVRKTPLSKTSYKSKVEAMIRFDESDKLPRLSLFPSRASMEKTVLLSPGPVGFELQPVSEAPIYGCRVTRFVDGGPENPGQARKSGIKPGDLVLRVEAEEMSMTGTTYNEIVDILKLSHAKRSITVQSTLESRGLTSVESDNFTEEQGNGIGLSSLSRETAKENNENETSTELNIEPTMMQHASFDNTVPSMASQMDSMSQTSPVRNRTILLEAAQGPSIVSLGQETLKSPLAVGDASRSVNVSLSSQDTAKSSNKATPLQQADSDPFSSPGGSGGSFEPYTSQISYETMVSGAHSSARTESDDIVSKEETDCPAYPMEQQEQNLSTADAKNVADITFFEDSLARADYEQRLQAARRKHSEVERELKDLYQNTCERNENKIRELEADRDLLQNSLDVSTVERNLITDARIKELEKQVAEAEKIKMRTLVEAREKIKANSNKCTRLILAKENEWKQRSSELENTINRLQEESDSRLVELDMSRTMIAEMESRIRSSETEKEELAIRLEHATNSIEQLEDSLSRVKQEDGAKEYVLEKIQQRFKKVLQENKSLVDEKQRFKEESSVLTEKLTKSVREKQQALLESQSIANKLNAENDDLMNQIAESTSDVEQLVEEKLLLEEKLALTWKNVEKAKSDASKIHETLLEKQENGEYFTSFDIEEKDVAIQALESKIDSLKAESKEEVIKSNKKTIVLHIQLQEAERKLVESNKMNAKTARERDDWHNTSIGLEKILANTKSQVEKMTEIYKNEMDNFDDVKARLEAVSKEKEKDDLQYQKSIESLSSKYEATKSELHSCEERLGKVESLKNDAIGLSEDLKVELEGVVKSKEEADLEYQKSIESLTLQLEAKRSELSSNEGRLADMKSLKKKQKIMTTNLKSQLAALAHAKDELEANHKKDMLSLSSELESKKKELAEELSSAKTKETKLEEQIGLLQEEKEHLVTKYENQVEELEAKLQIEGQKLVSLTETEKRHLDTIESLNYENKKETEEAQEKFEALTEVLQSQCEEFSCLELRSELLEDEYNAMKMAYEKATEEIDAIKKDKKDVECTHRESMERLTLDLESKQLELETIRTDLMKSIENLKLKNEETKAQYQEEIDEMKTTIESSSTEYWESVQELTTELQDQTEELKHCQSMMKNMEEDIESRKIDIESSNTKIQELEHEIFEKDILAGDMTAKIDSQAELLDGSKREISQKDELISNLQSRLNDLEKDLSDNVDLQKSYDCLKKSVADLETSKEKQSVEYCSEIFRFVKRLAILDQTHRDVNEQRKKAMSIAMTQRKLYAQAKSHIEKLENELKTNSSRSAELENILKQNQTQQKEKETELAEKSKQLEHQNAMTSSLQLEVSSLIRLTKHLKDSKEREMSLLKESNQNLESALSSEKQSSAQSAGNASDAKMELKMLDKKYNSIIWSKEEALLKSENSRTIIARNLLRANAVVASLRAQLSETNLNRETDELLRKSKEEIALLKEEGIRNERVIEDLKQTNEKIRSKMERMSESISENEQQDEQLHQALTIFEKNLLGEELNNHERGACSKDQKKDKKTRLLKNIEDLSTKLIFFEESMKQNEIIYKNSEESLKKSISKLRAEYIAKHLETNELKKKVAVLCQDKQIMKKDTNKLRKSISKLQSELERSSAASSTKEEHTASLLQRKDGEVVLLNEQLQEMKSQMEMLKEQKIAAEDVYEQEKKEAELLSLEKEKKLKELYETSRSLQATLAQEEKKAKEEESNRKSDAEKFLVLRKEFLLKLEILEKEKIAMADTISRHEERLRAEEEKFNEEIAGELSRLREKAGKLEAENFAKTSSLAQLNSSLESIRHRFRDLIGEKNNLEARLVNADDATSALQEKLHQNQMRYNEQQDIISKLQEEKNQLRKQANISKSDPAVPESKLSAQLSAVTDAFKIQAAVLEDVKLSESMLETLISEVMNLATQSEAELLELSSVLGTVEDLLLNPSSLLSSLDLAGLGSSERYFKAIRARLEDLAALAYTTSVELNHRQTQLNQWTSNRAECPVLSDTPPGSKQLKRTLFDEKEINSDVTPVITDGGKEVRDKVAGVRLLSCILENNNNKKLASAFRKWTCAAGALNAKSNSHKETAVELARELEITREKLMTLKNHLKSTRIGKQKPRLRRILERLDGNHGENTNGSDGTLPRRSDCSFEL